MNDFLKLMEPFIHFEMDKSHLEEPEILEDLIGPIFALNGFLGENYSDIKVAYLDQKNMEDMLFGFLPFAISEQDVFADEVEVYEALLDFYQFLQERNLITRQEYLEMLGFYQERKANFLAITGDMLDDLLGDEFEDEKGTYPQLNPFNASNQPIKQTVTTPVKPSNKIIAFPGMRQALSQDNEAAASAKQAVQKNEILQFRVDIEGFKPPVWRRVLVPATFSLNQLNFIIQNLFEWDNSHLHMFIINGVNYESLEQLQNADYSGQAVPSDMMMLKEIFKEGDTATYVYDFEDDWSHKIKLEKIVSAEELSSNLVYPVAIKGKSDAPVENSAGTGELKPFDLAAINKRLEQFRS